jgi:hypothetical protein
MARISNRHPKDMAGSSASNRKTSRPTNNVGRLMDLSRIPLSAG